MRRRYLRRLALPIAIVAALAGASDVQAQEADETSPWSRAFEAQGSFFVGNNPQSIFTTRGRLSFTDSTLDSGVDLRFTYGETSKDGDRQVQQRWWLATVNLDAYPHDRLSPFVLGTFESSLERRLLQRWNGGLGAKYTPLDGERTRVNLSLALLAERRVQLNATNARVVDGLARYSARFRARRQLNGRASLQLETFFQPEVDDLQAYLYSSNATLQYRMNQVMQLQFSYRDSYDTGAELRGARSNYDGQLVVGVAAEF